MKIKMLQTVRSDIPFLSQPETVLIAGEEYEAKANKYGAISGQCENGEYLGVRPGEFRFLDAPEHIRKIWMEVYPDALYERNGAQ